MSSRKLLLAGAFYGIVAAAQSIAFIQDGSVWTLPSAEATAPRRLSKDGGYELPRYSASGRYLAAMRKGVLTIFDTRDASSVRVGVGEGTWAPGSDRIAFVDQSGTYILSAETMWVRTTRITRLGAHLWSPNRLRLAAGKRLVDAKNMPVAGLLFTIKVDGGAATRLQRDQAEFEPLLWTASDELVVTRNDGFSASLRADGLPLYAISASGGNMLDLEVTALTGTDMLSLSPDRWTLAVAAGFGRESFLDKWIATYDFRTRQLRPLTPGQKVASISPAWSPDGKYLAYASSNSGQSGFAPEPERRIWVIDANGGNKRPVTSDPGWWDERPVWMDGGRTILFCRRRGRGGAASLWRVDADGRGKPMQLGKLDYSGQDYYGYVDWPRVLDVQHGY